jgi:hypothetical protein
MYKRLCPANLGAVVKPCADVPWHHVQFRMLSGFTSPADAATAEARIARTAISDLMNFIF